MTRQESQQCVCRWWVLLFAPSLYILQTCRQGDKQAKRLGSYSDLTHCPEKLLLFLRIHFPEQYLDFWLYFYVPLLAFSVIFFFGWLAWGFFSYFWKPLHVDGVAAARVESWFQRDNLVTWAKKRGFFQNYLQLVFRCKEQRRSIH